MMSDVHQMIKHTFRILRRHRFMQRYYIGYNIFDFWNKDEDIVFPLSKISVTWTFKYAVSIVPVYVIGCTVFNVSYWVLYFCSDGKEKIIFWAESMNKIEILESIKVSGNNGMKWVNPFLTNIPLRYPLKPAGFLMF